MVAKFKKYSINRQIITYLGVNSIKFNTYMKQLLYALACLSFCLSACKSDVKSSADDKGDTKVTESVQKNKYKLTPFQISAAYPDAVLSNMTYSEGTFNFDVTSDSYELGQQTSDAPTKMCANSGKGQHIHLIVDNSPYAAKYVSKFDHEVADGDHTILAFLSRSYHESIKTSTAHILKNVKVKDKAIIEMSDVNVPTLTYSRPKGTYMGDDTKKVMLDFYLSNVDLKAGYSVMADINGEKQELNTWQPYYIEGLPMGENSITLSLMKDNKVVDTPLNPVTRKFTLKADPEPKN